MNPNAVSCGLLIIIAVSCCAAAPEPVRIDVTMADYSFTPDHLTLERGVNYRLHLENHGNDTHEFTAPVFFATTNLGNPGALNRERSEVVVQPGEGKDVFLTPRSPGTYDLRCSDHDWAGMVGGVVVH
jgi:plastocyanin